MTKAVDTSIGRKQYPDVNGQPNPNNGKWAHHYEVGNESSRVLYLEIFRGSALAGLDYIKLERLCAAAGQTALADENNLLEDSPHYFRWRWWWD